MNPLMVEEIQPTRTRQCSEDSEVGKPFDAISTKYVHVIFLSPELSNEEELGNVPYIDTTANHTISVLIKQREKERYLAP